MTKSPMLWGAGLACALGGALTGNALGSAPILNRPAIGGFYQSNGDSAFSEESSGPMPLPNHYALVTRAGTVPVAELAERGLYSQARFRSDYASIDYEAARYAASDFAEDAYGPQYQGDDESVRIGDARAQANTRNPELAGSGSPRTPLALADGPAAVSRVGDAKLIDVGAALALP